jgi:argininosuccinate lyase
MAKLWDTSAGSGTGLDPAMDAFLSSTSVDKRLLPEDLEGSIAHARMLGEAGILPKEVADELGRGLASLAVGAEEGTLVVDPTAEDIHSFVEAELTARMGDVGRSLHAGRSRNDQVALDLRLWLRKASGEARGALLDAIDALCELASRSTGRPVPARAQAPRGLSSARASASSKRP